MEYRAFAPKDPFKPSLHYSLRNIFLGRKISTNHPQQLSRIPYPALEFESPGLRKAPSVKSPPPHPSLCNLADSPREERPPDDREPTISPRPSTRRPLSSISLPSPHSLASTRPLSLKPAPSPTPSLPSSDSSSHTESKSALYFSSHHSDDDLLRCHSDLSSVVSTSPYSPTDDDDSTSTSGPSVVARSTASSRLVAHNPTGQGSQESLSGNLLSEMRNGNERPASLNDEVLSITGHELHGPPFSSVNSLSLNSVASAPMLAQDISTKERSSPSPQTADRSFDGVPPSVGPFETISHKTTSVLESSLYHLRQNEPPPMSPDKPASDKTTSVRIPSLHHFRRKAPLLIETKPESEKNDVVSDIVPPSNPYYAPTTPSSKTNVDVEIVSTPSGYDENTMFGIPSYALAFVLDTIPRQLYHYLLLFLPSLYYSRVSRIFIDSQLSVQQIDKCILDEALERHRFNMPLWRPTKRLRRHVDVWSPYNDLEESWQALTDSFMREWNTLNIISGLLLTAIITVLQIGNAAKDPLIRHTALLSMICALMSLLYGCMYIVRFGTMQKTYKGAEWAYEADKPRTAIFWNVWVMLAMPAIWLGWAILMFIVCIGSFIWRTGTTLDDDLAPHTPHQVISARVVVSFILAMGIIYFTLIVATLREYGEVMDTAWTNRISGWVEVVYEHQRMEELRREAMHDVVHLVRPVSPRPVMQQVIQVPEREFFMGRPPSPMMHPHFEYAPPPPIPVYDPPPHHYRSEYVPWGYRSNSLLSHRQSPPPAPPPLPEAQSRASSDSSKSSGNPPFQPLLQMPVPTVVADYPYQTTHIDIPPPMPSVIVMSNAPESMSGSSRRSGSRLSTPHSQYPSHHEDPPEAPMASIPLLPSPPPPMHPIIINPHATDNMDRESRRSRSLSSTPRSPYSSRHSDPIEAPTVSTPPPPSSPPMRPVIVIQPETISGEARRSRRSSRRRSSTPYSTCSSHHGAPIEAPRASILARPSSPPPTHSVTVVQPDNDSVGDEPKGSSDSSQRGGEEAGGPAYIIPPTVGDGADFELTR